MKKILSAFFLFLVSATCFAVPAYTLVVTQYNESESQQNRLIYKPSENSFLSYTESTNVINWSPLSGVTMSSSQITDSSSVGRAVMGAEDQQAARGAIGAGTSNFSGSYTDLSNKPTNLNQFTNGPGYITASTAPVTSVNGSTGAVILNAASVGAASTSHTHTASQISDSTTIGRSLLTATDQSAVKSVAGVPVNVSQLTNDSGYITSSALSGYATSSQLTTGLAGKLNSPAGTTSQYIRGDGSLATFPSIPATVKYSGPTNSSGIYSVTYGSAYASVPNVVVTIVGGTNRDSAVLTSTTTGFSVLVERRTDIAGLLPTYAPVTPSSSPTATVNVLVTP